MHKYFLIQARNNAWANLRLGRACQALPAADLAAPRMGFFGSIIDTLNHILIADWFHVSALEGQSMGLAAFDPLVPFPDIGQYVAEQRKIDQRLIAVCKDPDLARGERIIDIIRGKTIQQDRFDRCFLQLIQHQIHHRGQVHNMLSGTSVAPPQLDEFYMNRDIDKARRADDLQELGMSEQQVWRDF